MGGITQDVNIEILEKLPDGNFKRKNPRTTKAQVGLGDVENYGIATKAEAEAGTSNVKYMTPLRTKEAIAGTTVFVKGSYVGDGSDLLRTINIGATPFHVTVIGTRRTGGKDAPSLGIIYGDVGSHPVLTVTGSIAPELRVGSPGWVTTFNGFTVGGGTDMTNLNYSGQTYYYIALVNS